MAYVRAKVINGRKYYYLVETKRKGRRVIQKVLNYLGVGIPSYARKYAKNPKLRKKKTKTAKTKARPRRKR